MNDHDGLELESSDGESFDGGPLDLTPRDIAPTRSAGKKWMPRLVIAGIGVALLAVLFQTLGDASLFFLNVDEAVERRVELGEQRFTLQGTPIDRASELQVAGQQAVSFTVAFDGVEANVVHIGSPAELFQPSVPVVLEGRWVDGLPTGAESSGTATSDYHFESTRMLVKHDNDYRVDNEDRLDEAERGGMVEAAQ